MNFDQKVILDSPLVYPPIMEVYRRVMLAVPDVNELMHLALLEAQTLRTSTGKSVISSIADFCEQLNSNVILEYSDLINTPYLTVKKMFENDIMNFVIMSSKFWRMQITFKGLSKFLLTNSKYLMIDAIVETEHCAPHIVTAIKDLTYVQLSRCHYSGGLSPESHFPNLP